MVPDAEEETRQSAPRAARQRQNACDGGAWSQVDGTDRNTQHDVGFGWKVSFHLLAHAEHQGCRRHLRRKRQLPEPRGRHLSKGGCLSLPYSDGRFDLSRLSRTVVHVPYPVRTKWECCSVPAHGGRPCFTLPNVAVCCLSHDRRKTLQPSRRSEGEAIRSPAEIDLTTVLDIRSAEKPRAACGPAYVVGFPRLVAEYGVARRPAGNATFLSPKGQRVGQIPCRHSVSKPWSREVPANTAWIRSGGGAWARSRSI